MDGKYSLRKLLALDTQKCYMSYPLFQSLNIRVASHVVLFLSEHAYICQVWPSQELGHNEIEYGTTVHMDNMESKDTHRKEASLSCKIKIVPQKKAKEVEIVLIVSTLEKLTEYRKLLKNDITSLTQMCKSVLYKKCVAKDFIINVKDSPVAELYGFRYVIIKHSGDSDEFLYNIDMSTKISIHSIECEERYLQLQTFRNFDSLGGLDSIVDELVEIITLQRRSEHLNSDLHNWIKLPRGILLCGAPGTGKTSLVNHLAMRTKAFLLHINGPEVYGSRPGEIEENLNEIFNKAFLMSEEGLCFLFMDEVDALCPHRWKSDDGQDGRATSVLLKFFDKLHTTENLVVIGATNRPSALDHGLRRPGRFDKEVLISVPTLSQRKEILRVHSRSLPVCDDLDLDRIADITNGYVGADLAAVCTEAGYLAMMERDDHMDSQMQDITKVEMKHFFSAVEKVMPSLQKGSECTIDLEPVYWADIGGLSNVKTQIQQAVEWPIKHPEAFKRMGLPCPRGVLLYGPPGCCKTTLVRAAATSSRATFLSLSGAQLYSPFVGDSEKMIAEVFQRARAGAPSIVFLDEVDSIIGKRSDSSSQRSVQERVLSTLLNEMDGIGIKLDMRMNTEPVGGVIEKQAGNCHSENSIGKDTREPERIDNKNVLVVAATNRPDLLDEALIRPGRIDRVIYVPPPDLQARNEILDVYIKSLPTKDVAVTWLAERTEYYTGADIQNLCREAALLAMTEDLQSAFVTMDHFQKVLSTVRPSLSPALIQHYKELRPSGGKKRIK